LRPAGVDASKLGSLNAVCGSSRTPGSTTDEVSRSWNAFAVTISVRPISATSGRIDDVIP
jgi:hypothetical protein